MFVFVDIETTGLDPQRDYILELGILVTDDKFRPLEVEHNGDDRQGIFSSVIRPEIPMKDILNLMPDAVRDMHQASGLIADLESGRGQSAPFVERAALEFLAAFDAMAQPMAGSSVHFDRGFLAEDMPQLERAFGYRNIDVSTLKELAARWSEQVLWTPPAVKAHRAVADIHCTINELAAYRKHMFL